MDDGKLTTFTEHITTHGTTVVEVVYTNDPRTVEWIIKKYEEWLKEEKNKFVGLDLEYTCKSSSVRQGIAVVQLPCASMSLYTTTAGPSAPRR